MISVTCIAPVNIAIIKYWGKRDEKLILPLHDSVSGTLSTSQMHAKTTIEASPEYEKDSMFLNDEEQSLDSLRLKACLEEMRRLAKEQNRESSDWHVHIRSKNNFPTAAGLASSAAGYACLVYALAQLYGIKGDLTRIARLGSGSACRSLYGGFVRWHKGTATDGSDSIATQIVPSSHWPELRVLILVVNDKKKTTSSTSGMQRAVETSELLKYRASHCVPQRVEAVIEAIHKKDFETFAEITMKDSNQFHAVAMDTYPPAVYMNDTSHKIVNIVHRYNSFKGSTQVAYTFDAGPNACLYMLESEVSNIIGVMKQIFPFSIENKPNMHGLPDQAQIVPQELLSALGMEPQPADLLKDMILTQIGEGPQLLTSPNESLFFY